MPFPDDLDDFTVIPNGSSDHLDVGSHTDIHQEAIDAIMRTQDALGVGVTGVAATVAERLGNIQSNVSGKENAGVAAALVNALTAADVGADPAGSAAAARAGYVHVQSSSSSSWNINHNLGFRPAVTVLDNGNNEVEADVVHVSANQAQVFFNVATTGTARLT